ncbi:MAG: hypothetical protein IK093_13380 [Ruminiclostridium sp.]|nr:hypothetical protein [Ruminiclostridium sp.]
MNNELTLQIFAFDCNAIPNSQHDNVIKAVKKYGAALKKTGRKQRVSGVRFTKNEEARVTNLPLEKFKVNTWLENDGSGACNMLDQTSNVINRVGERLASEPEDERPSQVIVTIIVFGRDNASVRCTYDKLREMIALQRDVYKWKFFLLTDFTINMEKLGIAEDDTILIKKSEEDWFKRPYEELTEKMVECLKNA